MLLTEGLNDAGDRVLAGESVRQMVTDHLTPEQRAASGLFTEGQGWGFGGAVDVEIAAPWNVLGRYGWVGGTGTTAHVIPATGTVAVLLTQMEMGGPAAPEVMRGLLDVRGRVLSRFPTRPHTPRYINSWAASGRRTWRCRR